MQKRPHNVDSNRMAYFCVPADFKLETLEKIAELNNQYKDSKIEEVYGSLPQTAYGSGRSSRNIPEVKISELEKYVAECHKRGITFNYVFNATTLGNREFNNTEKKKLIHFIKELTDAGVKRFTVALPSVISLINKNFKHVEIVLSAVNNITSIYQLNEFLDSGKVIRAYVAEEMNKKPHELKSISSKSKVPIATIVNPFCLFQCAYRYHHYNFLSFRNKNDKSDVGEYYQNRCEQIKANNPEEIIKIPFIRPSDINRYLNIRICNFKITGREMVNFGSDIVSTAKAYMDRSFDGDLIDLANNFSDKHYKSIYSLNSKSLDKYFDYIFRKSFDCSRDLCDKCGMCKKYAKFVKINKSGARKLAKFELLK